VLSRQSGYYKIKVGTQGQVGWLRVEDTEMPREAQERPPSPGRPGTPEPGTSASSKGNTASQATAKPDRLPKRGKKGKAQPEGFAIVPAEKVAGNAKETAEADDLSHGPASVPPPALPRLRLAWPPPIDEWTQEVRTWATFAPPLHLGIAGVITLLVILTLLYALLRFLLFLVRIPLRWIRLGANRIRLAVARRKNAPRKERPEVQRRLEEVEGIAAAVRASGPLDMSLHEVFVASGADDTALSALATAATAKEQTEGFPGWVDFLTGDDAVQMNAFVRAYLLEVIWSRAVTFLDLHPLFGGRGLRAERLEADQENDIAFELVSPDGLGVRLDADQQKVALFLTTCIERARVHLPNPYGVAHFAKALARGQDVDAEDEDSPTKADDGFGDVPPLSVLLFGASPVQHAGQFAAGRSIPREIGEALMLHMRAGTSLRYGPVHYAARVGVEPAVGVALVGAISGAMSASAATLSLRQTLASQPNAPLTRACAALGAEVATWLKEQKGRQREALRRAVQCVLGIHELDAALEKVRSLIPLHGRDFESEARRRIGSWDRVTLPQAMLHVHRLEVTATRDAVLAAAERYLDFLDALTERPDDKGGLAAPGFLCAGLGLAAFADAPAPMKVAIAEVSRLLTKDRTAGTGSTDTRQRGRRT